MGNAFGQPQPPDVVLVPPLFERDIKGRSRMAKSSYDYHFCKPGLARLFNDYISVGPHCVLNFRPAEDPRVSVRGRFDARDVNSVGESEGGSGGSVTIRGQRSVDDPMTFMDIRVQAKEGGSARVRGCYFDPSTGIGMFGVLPVVQPEPTSPDGASLGVRYNTRTASAGVVWNPVNDSLSQAWLVARYGPLTAGAQLHPNLSIKGIPEGQTLASVWEEAAALSSYAVSYSPPAAFASGSFTAAVEVRQQRQLVLSFLQHMAVTRRVKNPFEDEEVAGIVNYINIGMQVMTPLKPAVAGEASMPSVQSMSSAHSVPKLQAAVSWQANKNLALKAKVSTDSVSAALAFKAWWQPSFLIAASVGYNYKEWLPRLGLHFSVENYGNLRYERSSGQLFGGALVQRHVALPEDIMNKEGKGVLVQKKDLNDPEILGQVPSPLAQYL